MFASLCWFLPYTIGIATGLGSWEWLATLAGMDGSRYFVTNFLSPTMVVPGKLLLLEIFCMILFAVVKGSWPLCELLLVVE